MPVYNGDTSFLTVQVLDVRLFVSRLQHRHVWRRRGREFLSRVSTAILMRDIDICPSVCLSAKFR